MTINKLSPHFEIADFSVSAQTLDFPSIAFAEACTIFVKFSGAGNGGGAPSISAVTSSSPSLTWTKQAGVNFSAGNGGHVSVWTAQSTGPIAAMTIHLAMGQACSFGHLSCDGFTGLLRPLTEADTTPTGDAQNGGTATAPLTSGGGAITDTTSLEIGASIAGGNSSAPTFTASGYTQFYAPPANTTGQNTFGYKINAAPVAAPSYTSGPIYPNWGAIHMSFKAGADPDAGTNYGPTSYNYMGAGRRQWLIDVTTTAPITNAPVSNMVNGLLASDNNSGNFMDSAQSSKEFKFAFPAKVLMNEFKWYQSSAASQGTWKLAGSNDDSTYTDLLTGINLGAVATDIHPFGNQTGYSYYKLIQTAGTTNTGPWIQEVEFKLALPKDFATGSAAGSTSYSNQDGSGNRASRVGMFLNVATACGGNPVGDMKGMLDGVKGSANCTNSTALVNGQTTDNITIGFRQPLVIDEFTWFQQNTNSHGTWKMQGSLDNVSYTDLQTGIVIGAAATEAHAVANAAGYPFYRLVQTSGTTNSGPWLYEIEFKTSLLGSPSNAPQPLIAWML